MPRKYYYILAIPIIAFFTVVGIGYWQTHKTASSTEEPEPWGAGAIAEEEPYLPLIEEIDTESSEYKIAQLEKAIQHYRSAKSFRGTISQETSEGKVTGAIEYVAPLRLHATLTTEDGQGMEMIIVGETAYARTLDDDWKMTNDQYIKSFGRNFFASMINKTATVESFGIENKDQISWEWNKSKKCTIYQARYKVEEQFYYIEFCVNELGQIASITKQTTEGETTSEYQDYNTFFIIERPMLPLLEPHLEITGISEEKRVMINEPEEIIPNE